MTQRAHELSATADRQITELIDLFSTLDQAALRRPCLGREKLGDGTIGAAARHTADNYERIAGFVQTSDRMSATYRRAQHSEHRIPKLLRVLGHGPEDHAKPDHPRGTDEHYNGYTSENVDLDVMVEQLGASRVTLGRIAELTDIQLDAIPPKGSFRFCDGQRTLEQVLASLLRHQSHQVHSLEKRPRRSMIPGSNVHRRASRPATGRGCRIHRELFLRPLRSPSIAPVAAVGPALGRRAPSGSRTNDETAR